MPSSRLKLLEQVEYLGLDGHVEGGRRLVGYEEARLVGQGHRDHHALALAARELVRIGGELLLGLGEPHPSAASRGSRGGRRRRRGPDGGSRVSPSCFSTVCRGLSEDMGSWKTMPISSPLQRLKLAERPFAGRPAP